MSSQTHTHAKKSSATISLQFDFRGKTFTPSVHIDLDALMQKRGDLHRIYDMLAASLGLDSYSYEYDVMLMEELQFSEATGLVSDFITDNRLDFEGFSKAWGQLQIFNKLQSIAAKHLGIESLEQQSDIYRALSESYRVGYAAPHKTT